MSDLTWKSDLFWDNGNKLEIRNSTSSKLLSVNYTGKEVFHVDKDGNIIRDDVDITNNDKELAKCLIDYLRIYHKLNINREI